jgi:hypothetical protein
MWSAAVADLALHHVSGAARMHDRHLDHRAAVCTGHPHAPTRSRLRRGTFTPCNNRPVSFFARPQKINSACAGVHFDLL